MLVVACHQPFVIPSFELRHSQPPQKKTADFLEGVTTSRRTPDSMPAASGTRPCRLGKPRRFHANLRSDPEGRDDIVEGDRYAACPRSGPAPVRRCGTAIVSTNTTRGLTCVERSWVRWQP